MADLMATSADIQDALGRNYSVPEGIDEDELLGELDGLEGELASEAASAGKEGALPSYLQDDGDLPAAPTAQPQGTEALPARV